MGAFAEMFPGRKPEQPARDEDLSGQDPPPFRFPDGPLDLASGVVRIERRAPAQPADPAAPANRGESANPADPAD